MKTPKNCILVIDVLKIIDEEIGKINKTLFYDVSVEEMRSLKQTMNKLQKRVEEGK